MPFCHFCQVVYHLLLPFVKYFKFASNSLFLLIHFDHELGEVACVARNRCQLLVYCLRLLNSLLNFDSVVLLRVLKLCNYFSHLVLRFSCQVHKILVIREFFFDFRDGLDEALETCSFSLRCSSSSGRPQLVGRCRRRLLGGLSAYACCYIRNPIRFWCHSLAAVLALHLGKLAPARHRHDGFSLRAIPQSSRAISQSPGAVSQSARAFGSFPRTWTLILLVHCRR